MVVAQPRILMEVLKLLHKGKDKTKILMDLPKLAQSALPDKIKILTVLLSLIQFLAKRPYKTKILTELPTLELL